MHRCFPVYFPKFLRTPSFIEHLWWLLSNLAFSLPESHKYGSTKIYRLPYLNEFGSCIKMNFFSVGNCKKLFFSRTPQTWPHLLKKPLMEDFYFVLWICVINYVIENMLLKNISNRICQHRNRPFDRKSINFSWFVQCYISWMLRFAFTRLLLNKACKLC